MGLTIALLHMKLRMLAKKTNIEKARKLVHDASARGAKVVVLPSMVNVGPFYLHYPSARSKTIARNQAERIPGPTTEMFSNVAMETGTYIIGGPILERAGPKLFLTSFIVSPNGSIVAKYRKVTVNGMDVSLGVSNGKSLQVLTRFKRPIGVMAEDDVLYPEIARSLLLMGATILITSLRIGENPELIKNVLVTRSFENRVPILAVGGVFETPDKIVTMPTLVADPKRGIVEELKDEADTFILVEVSENPDNVGEIASAALYAKQASQIYCKAARESLIDTVLSRLRPEITERHEEKTLVECGVVVGPGEVEE